MTDTDKLLDQMASALRVAYQDYGPWRVKAALARYDAYRRDQEEARVKARMMEGEDAALGTGGEEG